MLMYVQRRLLPPATTATRDYGNRSTHGLFGWARARRAGSGVHVGLAPRVRGTYLSRRLGDPDVEVATSGCQKIPSMSRGWDHPCGEGKETADNNWEVGTGEVGKACRHSSFINLYPRDR